MDPAIRLVAVGWDGSSSAERERLSERSMTLVVEKRSEEVAKPEFMTA
jgi:hypothetical protein